MFGKSEGNAAEEHRNVGSGVQQREATSTILSGVSIVGKIVCHGPVTIFGLVKGELQASTVVIAEGAEVEGDIVAEEMTISGRVEGSIRANRVKLNSTAVINGDIFHRSLMMDENAQFVGASRRLEDVVNTSSRVQNRHQPQNASLDANAGTDHPPSTGRKRVQSSGATRE
jgi:cytoskeletal protein CcmA (bactofilin family)